MTRASTVTRLVLVAITAGLVSCGGGAGGDGDSEGSVPGPRDLYGVARAGEEQAPPAYDARAASARLERDSRTSVSSTASAEGGVRYVAGVFSGTIRLGEVELTSRGGDDVFVARVMPDGAVAWAHGLGSDRDESSPKVTFSDERVKIVAMTDGAADCGLGPLNSWSSETFFLCTFSVSGAPLNGASFPTGRR
ncbi:MAG: hypothetical protein KF850_40990 [Labilithrix sp.]|nr:hypothetical protein [Labilithrix sp.]